MLIVVAVSLLMSCLLGQNVNATEYHVGSGQTPYSTLQELQSAVITWYDDDVIFLHNDDGSLDYAFDFNGKRITISGNAKISSSGTNVRFSTTSSTTFLTIADGSSITWDGLKNFNGEGGAIYSSDNVNISGTSTFSNNTAGWYGGAILCSGNVDISGTSTFSNNTTISSYGGAIYSSGNVDISGTSTFSNNTAIYSGGAIFSLGNVDISGTSTFSNNTANYYSGGGGAIYSSGNINITASEGDIVFAGNKANVSPNAIYMNNAGNNKTLSLAATEGNSVLLYDPIVNVGTLGGININNGTTDKGTVLFDTYQSNISGNTTVFNGTLALSSGAVYGATINAGSFELKEDATLLVTGKDNTINSSGNVALTGTLVFDLTGVNTGETLLTCNGTTSGTIKKIDIRNFNGTGNFGLVKTTSGTLAIDASPILTTHGELIDNTRANGGASFSVTGTNTLRLNSNVKKQTITWTGNTNNIWNATTENWEDGGNAAIKFLHGDDVIFSDSSNALHNITIQDGGVTIGDTMTFADKGTWTYTGGEIEGGTIIVADNADTKIYFDTRPMNQRIEVGNSANVTIVPIFNNTLTFKNFSNSMYDGAIYAGSGSNLTIGEEGSNVVFDANSATYGGAIYSYGNVDISGTSTFSNNTATYYGGAIRSSGNVDISGTSTFSNNTANYYGGTYSNGGAISSSGNVDISGTSTFSNNTANYWGGAIDSGGDVTISGTSTFSNNTANYYGGGAIFSSGNVDISGTSTFSNN
ncbi:MAG: hypothetical protein LBK06_07135, partial [Planctomycetaceae bacterium]|nr:hypothetical protein [Planctomycetaceae bacterium]